MKSHDTNVHLATWSVASGLPLMAAVLSTERSMPRTSGREKLRRWWVTRKARARV
ncbi:hypothetical protein ACXR8F_10085 [Terrabacter sp. AAH1]